MGKRFLQLSLALPLSAYLFLTGCNFSDNPKKTLENPKKISVLVKPLALVNIPEILTAYGKIVAPESVKIRAQTSGVISSISFTAGQKVSPGQILLNIESSDFSVILGTLNARLVEAKQDYDRKLELSKIYPGGIAEFTLLQANQRYEETKSNYDKAGILQSVRTPIDGIISDTPFATGDYINAGDIVATVSKPDKLQILYQVPALYQTKLKIGQKIRFKVEGKTVEATVSYISPQADDEANLITLRADIVSAESTDKGNVVLVAINSFGTVTQIIDPDRSVITVDQNYIKSDDNGFYLFISKGNKVDKRHIVIDAISKEGLAIIRSGVEAGELLIINNIDKLKDGEPLEVMPS
ncbi:efflux RND transporter periplasmic adaptor subunit [Caedibacter taeniospiralis]|jgi:membrane fusion protein (multidrug efflux system)|uniref:efflux RND transporter periplasmic adaptor subunit n=1 Tax=Caedibacter taeniospiralis TaxID=28907 RepID=UPI0037BEEEEE